MTKTKRLHIRRCHLCHGVTENEDCPVDRCQHCGKPMAPFYFFNEAEVAPLSESELQPTPILRSGERKPIRGFTAYW